MRSAEIYQKVREVFVLLEFGNYETLKPYQLENIEYNALLLLDIETGQRMLDLRERLLCDKSKVTRMIDHFESRRLAQRQPDPEDRRAYQVFLTQNGLQLRAQAQAAFEGALENRLSGLSTMEQEQLLELLENLRSQLMAEVR
jgi:DNA-binding MarR family transcriptional regulator